ncbi:ABC transporter ATP-binding protein [Leptolyngbya sp. CCNP1308]|uniref:ABC transporter ATP-binding protein n=1 Tax=Leptolyngbya sp. CCNP1308 TaxID=3110255 RepID=UPI002B20DD0E|nr:ABC transporter ATP-binding protein [Leptolyngbya sp. CCNP1308]MEA5449890.1 ABC transporter ATP-binding protein [Leptolyngbya sp. CCNP1308]
MIVSTLPNAIAMQTQPILTLEHVGKTYANGTVALQDFNLAVEPGTITSLVGPSGCGKSTVLRIISELGDLTTGRMTWQSSDSHKLAYVFQEAALMPWATVIDNIRLPLKLAGVPKRQALELVSEAIAQVGLQGFERVYPRELSGGMKMRASIARALVTRPSVLLMDEPFGALDEMTRGKLNQDLLQLQHQRNLTILFVTHSIYEAVYLAHRVVVMASKPGRVVAEIAIDSPHPRDPDYRTSAQFNRYCRDVSHSLSEAMGEAMALAL